MMKNKYLYFIPRILSVLYLIFISMFAFDEPALSLGFLMHMVPSLILLVLIIISWKKSLFGAILFSVAGIATIFAFNTYRELIATATITLPLLITSLLFYLDSRQK